MENKKVPSKQSASNSSKKLKSKLTAKVSKVKTAGRNVAIETDNKALPNDFPKYGAIYWYAGSKHAGDSKVRLGIVVSKDCINKISERVQVVPLTTTLKVPQGLYAVRFLLPAVTFGLKSDSIAMCDKATTILSSRIKSGVVGRLDEKWLEHLKKCLGMAHENRPVIGSALTAAR